MVQAASGRLPQGAPIAPPFQRIPNMTTEPSAGRSGLMGIFADRKIGTKITFGFACVLGILALASGASYVAF